MSQNYCDEIVGTAAQYGLAITELSTWFVTLGTLLAGKIIDSFVQPEGHNWHQIWLCPAGFATVIFVLVSLSFKNEWVDSHE